MIKIYLSSHRTLPDWYNVDIGLGWVVNEQHIKNRGYCILNKNKESVLEKKEVISLVQKSIIIGSTHLARYDTQR